MSVDERPEMIHPAGEGRTEENGCQLDTFGGKVEVRWNSDAEVTVMGQMAFFIEFLKTAGLWRSWVKDSPLSYTSPNAPKKEDVLGTILLSVLAGHRRYAHITAIRGDGVNPEMLGMSRVVSEDSVRRAMKGVDEKQCEEWMKKHLRASYDLLLEEPWILDMDSTVKPLYGHQQKAEVGYNPSKPGRPSHVYHTYLAANIRMVMEVEVEAGNHTASSYAQPSLWKFVDSLPETSRPAFIRGDSGWGTERVMEAAEQRGLPYLLKLKQTLGVKKLLERLFQREDWEAAGQGWQGLTTELQLQGWSRKRPVVVLRRKVREDLGQEEKQRQKRASKKQLKLDLGELVEYDATHEYAVLVTTLKEEVRTVAQHYRDRGDAENNFDELKNQWGWTGFTTSDFKRCQIMAWMIALIYNWWTLFTRLAIPDKHAEAISTRPLLLHGIARRTTHGNQATLTITSLHGQAEKVRTTMNAVSGFLRSVRIIAEQFTQPERWRLILSRIFRKFLGGRILGQHTPALAPAS